MENLNRYFDLFDQSLYKRQAFEELVRAFFRRYRICLKRPRKSKALKTGSCL